MARPDVPTLRFLTLLDSSGVAGPGGDSVGGGEGGGGDDGGGGSLPPAFFVPTYGTTEFLVSGVTFGLVSSSNVPGTALLTAAGYTLQTVQMIRDGALDDFDLFISAVGGPPPAGIVYGVSYLLAGVYTEGFAVRI